MGAGPGSRAVAAGTGGIPWTRATLVWMLIALLETVHGIVRNVWMAALVGDLRARQWGVLVGSVLVLLVTLLTSRWLNAPTPGSRLIIGGYWVALTLIFEVTLGRATEASWSRIFSDYNPAQGGFMLLGLAVMFLAPWLVTRWFRYRKR